MKFYGSRILFSAKELTCFTLANMFFFLIWYFLSSKVHVSVMWNSKEPLFSNEAIIYIFIGIYTSFLWIVVSVISKGCHIEESMWLLFAYQDTEEKYEASNMNSWRMSKSHKIALHFLCCLFIFKGDRSP